MNKNTPLHVAAKHGHLLIAMQLVENGGDSTLANSYGESALDMTHAAAQFVTNKLQKAMSSMHVNKKKENSLKNAFKKKAKVEESPMKKLENLGWIQKLLGGFEMEHQNQIQQENMEYDEDEPQGYQEEDGFPMGVGGGTMG